LGGQKGHGNRDKKGIPQNGPEIPSRFELEQQGIRKKFKEINEANEVIEQHRKP
jgi:hypothetical protein